LTSFVGRERDIAELLRLIQTSRLTTLTGAGGVGKTRLALELVEHISHHDLGDVVLVELASVASPELVPQSVAAALGLSPRAEQDWLNRLVDVLRHRRLLMILDNCEHLVDACAELAHALLRQCDEVRILATSRKPLHIGGETIWRVSSLELPAVDKVQLIEELAECESVRLFTERAAAVLPGFNVTPLNARAVARVCRRLDGIPLALELAAARLPVLSEEQLGDRLDNALGLLSAGSRVAPPRHQTLRATLDWSYGLLPESEQLLFRRLGVFAGGWSLESAEAVCAGSGIGRDDVLEFLARLVDKSLVVSEVSAGKSARYRQLETVRQLAASLLSSKGESERQRDAHLRWFVDAARRANAKSAGWHIWFAWFFQEIDNIRAALDWAIHTGNTEAGLRLGTSLSPFWSFGSGVYAAEGLARLEAMLSLPDAAQYQAEYAAGLVVQGNLIRVCGGDLNLARLLGERGLALTRTQADARALNLALRLVGSIALAQRDEQASLALYQESLDMTVGADDTWRWEHGKSLSLLGFHKSWFGDFSTAPIYLEESTRILRAEGDRLTLAETLGYLAEVALQGGRMQEARAYSRETLDLATAVGSVPTLARALDTVLRLAAADERFEDVIRLDGALRMMRPMAGVTGRAYRSASRSVVDHARQQFGSERAAELSTQGAALSMTEAVALGITISATSEAAASHSIVTDQHLTDRELEVLRLLAKGDSNRQIAEQLTLSTRTVERHVENLYAKLGVSGRAAATAYALRQHLVA
jgi:non-specific serine/threonine protein kinase